MFGIAAFLCGAFAPHAAAASARFAHSVVAPAVMTGEPKVFVDSRTRPPTVYVVAPYTSTQLWKSTKVAFSSFSQPRWRLHAFNVFRFAVR